MKIFIVLLTLLPNNQMEITTYNKLNTLSGCWLTARHYNLYERTNNKTLMRCEAIKDKTIIVLPDYDNLYWTPIRK